MRIREAGRYLKGLESLAGVYITHIIVLLTLTCFAFALLNLNSIRILPPAQTPFVVVAENFAREGRLSYHGAPYTLYPPMIIVSMAAFIKAGFDALTAFKLLNIVCYALSCILIYRLSASMNLDRATSAAAALIYASTPAALFHALDYMPDTLFSFICLLWFYLFNSRKYAQAGVVASFASVTRLQGLLLLIFGAAYLILIRRNFRTAAAYSLLSVLMPLLWGLRNIDVLTNHYGMPLQTLLSKPQLIYMSGLVQSDLSQAPALPKPHLLLFFTLAFLVPISGSFVAVGLLGGLGRTRLMAAFTLSYFLMHVTLPGGMDNIVRHLLAAVPFISIWAAAGVRRAVSTLQCRNLALAAVLGVMVVAQINIVRTDIRNTNLTRQGMLDGVMWLDANLPGNATVVDMMEDVNSLPFSSYYSKMRFTYSPALIGTYSPMSKYAFRQVSPDYLADDTELGRMAPEEYVDYVLAPERILHKLPGWRVVHTFSVPTKAQNPPVKVLVLENPRRQTNITTCGL